MAHESWVGGMGTLPSALQAHMLSLPGTAQAFPQASTAGRGRSRGRVPPQKGAFTAHPRAPPEDEVRLFYRPPKQADFVTSWPALLRGPKDGKGLVSPTGTSFPMQEASPNHF